MGSSAGMAGIWLDVTLNPWGGESVHALLAMAATHATDKLLPGQA